jgi:hypothetical protein
MRQAPPAATRSRTVKPIKLIFDSLHAPVGREATTRQAPPPATRSRTSHCATAARRSSGPARAAMPAAAALCPSTPVFGQTLYPASQV